MIYSLYIFDRYVEIDRGTGKSEASEGSHCTCVYYQDWNRTNRARPAAEGNIIPGVSAAVSTNPRQANDTAGKHLSSSSGVVIAVNESPATRAPAAPATPIPTTTNTKLPFDEEAKLVYGVVISIRNMVKKLSGRQVSS